MDMTKQNAVPDVTVGAATGQHLSNSRNSITNEPPIGNDEFSSAARSEFSYDRYAQKGVLNEISMTELYDQVYAPKAPVVDGLLYPGLYLFVGAPKVGKSFFMAQLAYHVAAGLPLWDYQVSQGTVLYLALEDDYARLQKRLSRMFDVESSDYLHLATRAGTITIGLREQLNLFIKEHPDTRLIIIDTLQRIRDLGGDHYSYSNDYEVANRLKQFADEHGVCLMIVHHTRKMESEDSFEMISGTNGLLGAADGAFVLQKKRRTDRMAVLSVVGRDQQEQELSLAFNQETCQWLFVKAETELWKMPPDPLLELLNSFLEEEGSWCGSSTDLLTKMQQFDPGFNLTPNALGRKLNVRSERMYNEYGILLESTRNHNGRLVKLVKTN